jgi:hypothetical protein
VAMDITNQQDLQKLMLTLAEEALDLTTEEVIRLFRNNYLKLYAYIANPQMYERTYEFYKAWQWSEVKKDVKSLATELYYNSDDVKTFDAERFIHGSKYSKPENVSDTLPEILEGKKSSLWLSVYRPIKFWEKFLEDMLDSGQLEKILYKHFSTKGFTRI